MTPLYVQGVFRANLGSPVQGELAFRIVSQAEKTEGLYPLTRYSVYTIPLFKFSLLFGVNAVTGRRYNPSVKPS